jgi:hypothetical protein
MGKKAAPTKSSGSGKRNAPTDFFEVEEEEAEETKNKIANRYDKVDNYEYEMPSDFEDEEVDEDEAFTAGDDAKFAEFFAKVRCNPTHPDISRTPLGGCHTRVRIEPLHTSYSSYLTIFYFTSIVRTSTNTL